MLGFDLNTLPLILQSLSDQQVGVRGCGVWRGLVLSSTGASRPFRASLWGPWPPSQMLPFLR